MDFNKKRIFVVIIVSIILVLAFMFLNFTDSRFIVKGEMSKSYVNEGETEFDLENDASLRRKPDFSSKIVGTIKKGKHVQVLSELNKWVKISDGTNEGWVVKQSVVTIETEVVNEVDNNVSNNQVENNIVNNSNTTENKVENKIENSATNVTNNVSNNTTLVTNETSNNTSSNTSSNVGKTGVVNVDTAKVRKEPDGKLVGLVDLNDKVEILAEEGDWYKVNVDEYENCYIAKRLVTIKK